MKLSKTEQDFKLLSEKPFDFIGLFIKYLHHWKWFVISLLICAAIAVIYLKFSLPLYKIETTLLFKDSHKGSGSSSMDAFNGRGLISQQNNVENEMEVLGSSLIGEKVVRELQNYASYTQYASLFNVLDYKKKVLYAEESPLHVTLSEEILNRIEKPIVFKVLIRPTGMFEFSGEHKDKSYTIKSALNDSAIIFPFGEVNIFKTDFVSKEEMLMEVTISNPMIAADQFISGLKMELTSKTSAVVEIALSWRHGLEGKDF